MRLPKGSGVKLFGIVEVIIGSLTLIALLISLISGSSQKPPAVLIFVFATSVISIALGLGILRRNLSSYHFLLFFATTIILSKVLIFAKIISLNGALETRIPADVKNAFSIVYHAILIWYFTRPSIKEYFGERSKNP